MNGTPKLRSAFPATPQQRARPSRPSSLGDGFNKPKLPRAQEEVPSASPVIPLEFLDAATQRSIAFALWGILWAWKFSDAWSVYTSEDPDSLWQFMKWLLFDGIFLFAIPSLRIPWMEWSTSTMTIVYLVHAVADASLMFQIGLPIAFWAEWAFKKIYDRGEMSVTERFVRRNQVIDTNALLQGKHVINILPEGYVLTLSPCTLY
jgi:nucleoporin POM152